MSAASDILKNFNLFVDGVGFAGNAEEVQLPALNIIEEDFRAGGMDSPIGLDMGIEKLETSFKIAGFSSVVLKQF
jgi:P2 family phage contractile tail tube protein